MDSKFKLIIGLLVSGTLIYFYFDTTPAQQKTLLSPQKNESVEIKHNTTSKRAKITDSTKTVANKLPIYNQTDDNINVIDSLEKLPKCNLDPSNPALVKIQRELEQAKVDLISQWQHVKNTQVVTVKQQVDHIIFGIEQSSDLPAQLEVFKQYLTKYKDDNLALTAAIKLCGKVKDESAICDDYLTAAVADQKNGRLTLALANSKLKQNKYDAAEALMRQAIKQPIFQDTATAFARKAQEFYSLNTNLPTNKSIVLSNGTNRNMSSLFALVNACASEQSKLKTSELCYDVGLQLYQNGTLTMDKMIGHVLLQKYYQKYDMVHHQEQLEEQQHTLTVKTKLLNRVFSHLLFEDRLIPTYLSEAYDHSEQARMTALAEQLLDYYQDPNYTPCQIFNQ